jgi:MYXO-CTERM domain-containing protein
MKAHWAVAILAVGSLVAAAHADVVFGNFEDGGFDGFGTFTPSSGIAPFPASPGPTVTISTPPSGGDTTKVLDVAGAGFDGGQSGGEDVGYDFVTNGNAAAFMANDILTFNWIVPVSSTPSGFNQIFNVVLNAPGGGFKTVGGQALADNSTDDENPPYDGRVNTISINYDAYKATISANPGFLQLGITTNNGGGAPAEVFFDNFTLSANPTPEPASCALLGVGAIALLRRRR